jgi:hypothetical protein
MKPVKTVPGIEGVGGIKESGGGCEYKYDIFDIRTFINATLYPPPSTTI